MAKSDLINILWVITVLIVGVGILWLSTFMANIDREIDQEQKNRNETFEDSEKKDG